MERPSTNGMEQVTELLALIDQRRLDGVIVATNFTFRWVQPSKERAHPEYEFQGETDGTREISRDEVKRRISTMFNLVGRLRINDQQRPFHVGSLPPWVRVLFLVSLVPFAVAMHSFIFLKICG